MEYLFHLCDGIVALSVCVLGFILSRIINDLYPRIIALEDAQRKKDGKP